jgi:phage shock protein A
LRGNYRRPLKPIIPCTTLSLASAISPSSRTRSAQSSHIFFAFPATFTLTRVSTSLSHTLHVAIAGHDSLRTSGIDEAAMGIFDRMGRVISSNLNSLLDKAEDQKKLLSLNIEEMDEQLKRAQKEVISAVAAEKQLRKKCDDLGTERDKWDKRAELALKSGDEALAREALKQKKRVAGEIEAAESARVEQRNAALNMKQELERMREKLAEIKMKKGTIEARAVKAAAGVAGAPGEGLGAKGGSSAFDEFRKMEEKIEGREAEVTAMAEVDDALGKGPSKEDLEAKFRALEGSLESDGKAGKGGAGGGSDVDEELAALKKRIRV